jgi:holo-[acyl-carrier protein] synthase
MIKSIGVDICKNSRLNEKIINKILTDEEIIKYNSFNSSERKNTYLAGRFAIKEALIKAFSKVDMVFSFRDFTILNDEFGRPFLKNDYSSLFRVHLTLSHEEEYSVGFVVIESLNEKIK